jgi:hypothetical protein
MPSGPDEGKRILSRSHFEDSLERTSPSVSKTGLLGIRSFAKEYDPVALRRNLHDEELERDLERKKNNGVGSKSPHISPTSTAKVPSETVLTGKTAHLIQSFQLPVLYPRENEYEYQLT